MTSATGGPLSTEWQLSPPSPTTQWESAHNISGQAATLRSSPTVLRVMDRAGGRVGKSRPPLDLRAFSPRQPDAEERWRHRIRRLDPQGRLTLPEAQNCSAKTRGCGAWWVQTAGSCLAPLPVRSTA